jgi:hypothetical protein
LQKKIAIIARDKQNEAFRMAAGLTILDDLIDIFVLDSELENDELTANSFNLVRTLELNIYTNNPANKQMHYISTDEIALKLLDYDLIDPC